MTAWTDVTSSDVATSSFASARALLASILTVILPSQNVTKVSLKVTIFALLEGCLTVRTLVLPFSLNGTQIHFTATKVLVYSINDIYLRGDSSKRFDTLKKDAAPLATESGKRCHIT